MIQNLFKTGYAECSLEAFSNYLSDTVETNLIDVKFIKKVSLIIDLLL